MSISLRMYHICTQCSHKWNRVWINVSCKSGIELVLFIGDEHYNPIELGQNFHFSCTMEIILDIMYGRWTTARRHTLRFTK